MINYVKQLIRTAFRKNGYNIHATPINPVNNEELLMNILFKKYDIDLILDVGASRGQYVDSIRKMGYDKNFMSFEPVLEPFKVLYDKFENDPKVSVGKYAIGDKNKDIIINVSKCDLCSSILDVTKTTTDVVDDAKYVSTEKCMMRRLDEFYPQFKKYNNLMLKIDTQGFEDKVLIGATKTLSKVKVIFIEMSLVELYKGEAKFSDLVKKLEQKGFELYAITPAFMDNSTGRMLQVDGLFVKKEKIL